MKLVITQPSNTSDSVEAHLASKTASGSNDVVWTQGNDDTKTAIDDGSVVITGDREITSKSLGKAHQPVVGIYGNPNGTGIAQALDSSYSALLKDRRSLMLSNIHQADGSPGRSLIITPERGIKPVRNVDLLPEAFDNVLQSRINNRHYKTNLTQDSLPVSITDDLEEISRYTKLWASWSLFPKFELKDEKYPGAEFGFVSKRTDTGTLITARGSNKEKPTINDYALVEKIEDGKTLHVKSVDKKASLNAPLAHYIFENRPEINYVVHSHIFMPEGANASTITSPGTQEDWQSIESLVKAGAKIINQPLHGTLILLEKPDELLEILKQNSLYHQNSELYDLAYARFQSSEQRKTTLEKVVEGLGIAKDSSVLDLCCGTGASTEALQDLGFTNIDIADGSRSMLSVAEKRLGKTGLQVSLPSLDGISKRYDLITMRQAFNYISPTEVRNFAGSLSSQMNSGARFVFNTFGNLESGIKTRDNEFEDNNTLVRTKEINHIDPDKVLHTQRSEIVDFNRDHWDAVLDINEFYQHDLDQVVAAFHDAGFKVETYMEGNSICFTFIKN